MKFKINILIFLFRFYSYSFSQYLNLKLILGVNNEKFTNFIRKHTDKANLRREYVKSTKVVLFSHLIHLIFFKGGKKLASNLVDHFCVATGQLDYWRNAVKSEKGLIIATPHYGSFLIGLLLLARLNGHGKEIHVFFDDPANNPQNQKYIDYISSLHEENLFPLTNTPRNIVKAIKLLKGGHILVMLPDVFTSDYFYVPFMGQYFKTMGGTAFFSSRANVNILPTLCASVAKNKFIVDLGNPIPPVQLDIDAQYRVKIQTMLMFKAFEKKMLVSPEPWYYWKTFSQFTSNSPVSKASSTSDLISTSFLKFLIKFNKPVAKKIVEHGYYLNNE